jgi:hypothetical protein
MTPLEQLKAHFEKPPTILDTELDVPNDVLPFYLEGYADCHEATKALVGAAVEYAFGLESSLAEWQMCDEGVCEDKAEYAFCMKHYEDLGIRALLEKGD